MLGLLSVICIDFAFKTKDYLYKGRCLNCQNTKKNQLLQVDIVESTLKIPPVGLDKV